MNRVHVWSVLALFALGCSVSSKFDVGSYIEADAGGLDASGHAGSGFGAAAGRSGNNTGGYAGAGVGGAAGWANAGGQTGAGAGGTAGQAGSGADAGAGAGGVAGSSGADAGGGTGGVAGTGGSSGADAGGGTGGVAGSGGSSVDAGSDAQVDAGDACTPTTYYRDNDHDGYGGTTTVQACTPPSTGTWVTKGGDCDDSNDKVHPGQSNYFTTGYTPPGSSQVSFDYNCDNKETESGSNPHLSCHWATFVCLGGGYLPVTPSRSGTGVDNYCGSSQRAPCWPTFSGGCKAGSSYTALSAIACH